VYSRDSEEEDEVDDEDQEEDEDLEHEQTAVRLVLPTGCRPPAPHTHSDVEITPLLPIGIGERCSQTISNLGHAALLRRCKLPPINESPELNQGGPLP
jgi:hypothetical protein